MKKALIFIVILIAIGLIVYFVSKQNKLKQAQEEATTQTLGETLFESTAGENPAENLPELNPFDTSLNPYSDGYKNPFAN